MPASSQDQAQATVISGSDDTVRIGRPVRKGLPLVLVTAVPTSFLLAVPTARLFGDAAWSYLVAAACWLAVLPGGLLLYLVLRYRPVTFNPRSGTTRLGRTTVPLATVTTARREFSTGPRSSYLSYQFASPDGAWGRVLVAGRPMRGLSPEERQHLIRFVEASGIQDPDTDGLSPVQQHLANQFTDQSTRNVVGKSVILAELRGEPVSELAAAASDPTPTPTPEQWERDDRDAEAYLRDQRAVGLGARRFFGLLTAVAVLAGVVTVIVAAVMEESSASGSLGTDTNTVVSTGVLGSAAVGLIAYTGYCVACFVNIRHAQRVSLNWLRGRDPGQLARGLPLPLLSPFVGPTPSHRLKTLVAFVAAMVGMTGLIAAPVMFFLADDHDLGRDVAVIPLVVGAAATVLAVALYIQSGRAKRRQNVFVARAGRRLYDGPGHSDDPVGEPPTDPAE